MIHTFRLCSDEAQLCLKVLVDRDSVQRVYEFVHPLLLRNGSLGFLTTFHMVLWAALTCVLNFASFYLF
jgi:hypothetical protein